MTTQPLPAPTVQTVYVQRPSRGMAVSSLVLGVVGISIGWIPILGYFAFPIGILGVILGLAAVHKAKRDGSGKTMPRFGWLLSLLAIGVAVLGAVAINKVANDVDSCLGGNQAACESLSN